MKKPCLILLLLLATLVSSFGAKKNVLMIYGDSTHNKAVHNNVEVATLIQEARQRNAAFTKSRFCLSPFQ